MGQQEFIKRNNDSSNQESFSKSQSDNGALQQSANDFVANNPAYAVQRKENTHSPLGSIIAQMKQSPEEEESVQMKQSPEEEESVQMKQSPEEEESVQMKQSPEEEESVQMKSTNDSTTTSPVSTNDASSNVMSKMENSFGADFSNVNIHKDSSSATNMGALAYAQGNDIHFAPGQYNPNTTSGQELLGHELAHVVQQRQGRVKGTQNKGGANVNNDTSLEKEADVQGAKAAKGESVNIKGKGDGIQKQTPTSSSPTEKELDAIEARYRQMVSAARKLGFSVAADNLEHFLDGGGTDKVISSSWLRKYGPITSAEDTNLGRFEKSLKKEADKLVDGQTKTFTDYWDKTLYANPMTELYFASGGSSIKSTGTFKLSRKGNKVTIKGDVNHHWFDPYDWHAGLTAFVPGFGNISDADALKLETHRGASPFLMYSDYTHSLSGWVETDRWTDYWGTDFVWTK